MALSPNNPSPGVYTYTIDNGAQTSLAGGGIATLCLPLPRGQIGKNMTITNSDIPSVIGPATGIYKDNVNILKLLSGVSRYLNVCRVALNAYKAGVLVTTYNNFATTRSLAAGVQDPTSFVFTTNDIMLITAKYEGDYGNNLYVTFEPNTTDPEGVRFYLHVYEGSSTTPSETHECTTFYKVDDSGMQLFVEEVVNYQSKLIDVHVNANHYKLAVDPEFVVVNAIGGGPYLVNSPLTPNGQLSQGSDGDLIDVFNSDANIANNALSAILDTWDVYKDWETTNVGIACDGGIGHPAIAAKLQELEQRRTDCVCNNNVPPYLQDRDNAVGYRQGNIAVQGMNFNVFSNSNTLTVSDVKSRDSANARDWWVPASVCMTYTMLVTDQEAAWLAPAGVNRGGLDFATSMRYKYDLSDRNILTDNNINMMISFNDDIYNGIYMWLADSLQVTNSPLKDIGVCRLLALLRRTVRITYLKYCFKLNDDLLREQIKTDLERLLQPIKNGRGLDWFEVVCDSRNNPDSTEANGDLVVDVYLDPTRYTKRIMLNADIAPTGQIQYVVNLISKSV
jgi:hypothetical protein